MTTPSEQREESESLVAELGDLADRLPPGDQRDRAVGLRSRLSAFVESTQLLLARYQLLFEEVPDPYLVTDELGRVTEANAAARAMLDRPHERLVGCGLISFVNADDRPMFERWLDRLRGGEPELRWDVMFDLGGPEPVPVEIRLADDLDGIGYRWVLREQRLRKAVEQHLRDVALSEHDAAGALRADAQVQTAFLVALAHDLRAPIGALVHQAQLLGMDELDPELRNRSVEILQENAGMISRMMEDLVDIERHALGELQLRRQSTRLSAMLDAMAGVDDVEIRRPVDDDAMAASVDLDVLSRAFWSAIRATRRRALSDLVHVTGHATGELIEIAVATTAPAADGSDPTIAARMIETRLTESLVDAHGGSVAITDDGIVIRLPQLQPPAEGAR